MKKRFFLIFLCRFFLSTLAMAAPAQEISAVRNNSEPIAPDSSFGQCPPEARVRLQGSNFVEHFLLGKEKPWERQQDSWAEYNRLMNIRVATNAGLVSQQGHLGKATILFLTDLFHDSKTESREDAKLFIEMMAKNGLDENKIKRWTTNPPLMTQVFYPRNESGPVTDAYKKLVQQDVLNFVTQNSPTAAELEANKPGITGKDIRAVQSATASLESMDPAVSDKPAYDLWMLPLHSADLAVKINFKSQLVSVTASQLQAIDAVARTLWGEALSCAQKGLPQFEAIGRIICERSQAVDRSLVEQTRVTQENSERLRQFGSRRIRNDSPEAKIRALEEKLHINRLNGLSDFGRADALNLEPVVQVISKAQQFPIWNSTMKQSISLGNFYPKGVVNIPDVTITLQKPQSSGDDSALLNAVCPDTKKSPKDWLRALELAKQIVLTPKEYLKKYQWVPATENVLFYSYTMDLPFAQKVAISGITLPETDKAVSLTETALGQRPSGPCGQFQLYTPLRGVQF